MESFGILTISKLLVVIELHGPGQLEVYLDISAKRGHIRVPRALEDKVVASVHVALDGNIEDRHDGLDGALIVQFSFQPIRVADNATFSSLNACFRLCFSDFVARMLVFKQIELSVS